MSRMSCSSVSDTCLPLATHVVSHAPAQLPSGFLLSTDPSGTFTLGVRFVAWRIPPWPTDMGGAYLVGRIMKEAICARTALPATFSWRCFTSPSLSSLLFAVRKCRSTSACHTCSLQSHRRAIWSAKVSPSLSCKSSSRLFDAACLLSRYHLRFWLRTSRYLHLSPLALLQPLAGS